MKLKYLIISTALLAFSLTVHAQSKLGTVNVDAILSKLPELTQVQTDLKAYNDSLEKDLQEKVAVYKTKLDAYQKGVDTFSDVMKKTKGEELIGLENDINKFRDNGRKLIQLKKDDLLRPLYKKISDMIAVVAKEQQYTQILTVDGNEFAYTDEKLDITLTVMKKLGIKTE